MNEKKTNESDKLRRRKMIQAATRAVLRVVPLVPAPELLDLLEAAQSSRRSIDQNVDKAVEALRSASRLIEQLEVDLNERTERLARLRDEVDKYSKLATIEEAKARALVAQLDTLLNRRRGRERWVSLAISILAGLLFFALGIVAGPQLTRWWQGEESSIQLPRAMQQKGHVGPRASCAECIFGGRPSSLNPEKVVDSWPRTEHTGGLGERLVRLLVDTPPNWRALGAFETWVWEGALR